VGNKTHPIGFRLGIIPGGQGWQARWFAPNASNYKRLLQEDFVIRNHIEKTYRDAGVALVEIERGSQDLSVFIHTARPGIVIGRQGQRVDQFRTTLEEKTGKRIRVNVQEIRQSEMNAILVARNIAEQLERRVAFRRAIRQAAMRTMQAGAQGIKILCSGRLAGAEIARKEKLLQGRVPLHTLRADIDYGLAEAATSFGRIGVKVWIYKGEILPKAKDLEIIEDMDPIQVTVTSSTEDTVVSEDRPEIENEPEFTQQNESTESPTDQVETEDTGNSSVPESADLDTEGDESQDAATKES
jgi:small subunit ribosomal protein S3